MEPLPVDLPDDFNDVVKDQYEQSCLRSRSEDPYIRASGLRCMLHSLSALYHTANDTYSPMIHHLYNHTLNSYHETMETIQYDTPQALKRTEFKKKNSNDYRSKITIEDILNLPNVKSILNSDPIKINTKPHIQAGHLVNETSTVIEPSSTVDNYNNNNNQLPESTTPSNDIFEFEDVKKMKSYSNSRVSATVSRVKKNNNNNNNTNNPFKRIKRNHNQEQSVDVAESNDIVDLTNPENYNTHGAKATRSSGRIAHTTRNDNNNDDNNNNNNSSSNNNNNNSSSSSSSSNNNNNSSSSSYNNNNNNKIAIHSSINVLETVEKTVNVDDKAQLKNYHSYPNHSQTRFSSKKPVNAHSANATPSLTNTHCKQKHSSEFKSALDQLHIETLKKGQNNPAAAAAIAANMYGQNKKSLGSRRTGKNKFNPPIKADDQMDTTLASGRNQSSNFDNNDLMLDDYLKNLDSKLVDIIMTEIIDHGPPVHWNDIAGLEFAKNTITEIIIWPMKRPDMFTGLRGPPKGILLFGPPGTGKTLIGKCIASQSNATFFSISASSLTSKWVGEGEKLVRALFSIAKQQQPSVIFIDEIDSLLSQRSSSEHESSRRIKTEFLVQLDGATTLGNERVLVVGATNRPQEIDEAARRRLSKRLYIPLPDGQARRYIVSQLMQQHPNCLTDEELDAIRDKTNGYSGADMRILCREAALGPIRCLNIMDICQVNPDEVRPINFNDFLNGLSLVKPSVSQKDLEIYTEWNQQYGCTSSI